MTVLEDKAVNQATLASPADSRVKEQALLDLSQIYTNEKDVSGLAQLIKQSQEIIISVPKGRTAKLVKSLVDMLSSIPNSLIQEIEIVKDTIVWSSEQKRLFLRQSMETRLCSLYLEAKMYTDALALSSTLLKELKKLDDKVALLEVQLLESKVFHQLRNLPKARASLTSARTSANSIYCPPLTQSALDMQSGILHAEERDYKTAYSYFYETLENLVGVDDVKGVLALKYMLLCKIMLNLIVHGKVTAKYQGSEVEAMKAIAKAHENRSLSEFESALLKFKQELGNDLIIRSHLSELYDTLLEQNLLRIIEPYSTVEISHIAELVKLPTAQVEAKYYHAVLDVTSRLSQMILDNAFEGILDQGAGCLEVFQEAPADNTYTVMLETIKNMEGVVESLFTKASKLN